MDAISWQRRPESFQNKEPAGDEGRGGEETLGAMSQLKELDKARDTGRAGIPDFVRSGFNLNEVTW